MRLGGDCNVRERLILYDDALGARAIQELRSYVGQETLYDKNAYTIVESYRHGSMNFSTVQPTPTDPDRNCKKRKLRTSHDLRPKLEHDGGQLLTRSDRFQQC